MILFHRLVRRAASAAALSCFLTTALATAPIPAPHSSQGKERASATPGATLVADKGKLRIVVDGQPVGVEEFEISPAGSDWLARGSTEVRAPDGAETRVTAQLKLAPDASPQHYEWVLESQKKASASIDFENGTAKLALRLESAQPFLAEFSFGTPRVAILDNNFYHHYAVLARLYDWNTGGTQTFPVLIPQDMTPGSITVENLGAQSVEGKSYETLRMRSADLEVDIYLDSSHRLMRLAVPASKAVVVRE